MSDHELSTDTKRMIRDRSLSTEILDHGRKKNGVHEIRLDIRKIAKRELLSIVHRSEPDRYPNVIFNLKNVGFDVDQLTNEIMEEYVSGYY